VKWVLILWIMLCFSTNHGFYQKVGQKCVYCRVTHGQIFFSIRILSKTRFWFHNPLDLITAIPKNSIRREKELLMKKRFLK
jgi:hypothetical protein